MGLQTVIILIIIGLLAGMLSGLVGIGGGIIIVPCLVFFAGFSQKQAQGTSLFILLLPVGILAVRNYYEEGNVNIKTGFIIAVSFIIGAYLGSKQAHKLNDEVIKKVFATMLILVAAKMLFIDNPKTKENNNSDTTKTAEHTQ